MSDPTVSAKRISLAYAVLGLLAIAGLVGLALYVLTEDTRRDHERIVSRYIICLEVEKLKAGRRQDANRTYRELGRTLRILKLSRTPEIEQLARENRDRDLVRYAKDDCVQVARDPLGLDIHVPEKQPAPPAKPAPSPEDVRQPEKEAP